MKIYNSLTKQKETLTPRNEGVVSMYSCGPTVYYYPHIGNMRAYLFMDSLRRCLEFVGYNVQSAMNITDVGHLTSDSDDGDDKMEVAAKRENKNVMEIAEYYTNIFFENFEKLNIKTPQHVTKATEYINQMIEFIQKLEQKGYTYMLEDGLYFDISKFKGYGKLSNKNMDSETKGRIMQNSNKKHEFDFALWKFVDPKHIMKWDSPWGVGCPGWHIECSAMAADVFGEYLDIHTGGIDHLTVHHENEIAQSDSCFGHKCVSNWMHCEFLQVDGGKMSKSLNNIYTIAQLEEKGFDALDFKYFCLTTHYRKAINFTFDALTAAKNARESLMMQIKLHKNSNAKTDEQLLEKIKQNFKNAVEDDLNMPLALASVFEAIKLPYSIDVYNLVQKLDVALGLKLNAEEQVPAEIELLAKQRWQAKKDRNFAQADALRTEVLSKGYEILDSKDGYQIIKK